MSKYRVGTYYLSVCHFTSEYRESGCVGNPQLGFAMKIKCFTVDVPF